MWLLKKFFIRSLSKLIGFILGRMDLSKPELLSGPGSLLKLPALIQSKGVRRVLLVSDKGITSIGLIDPLLEALDKAGIDCTVFDDVQPNPTIANIESGVEVYLANQCEGIIAFGGGSPMDCAKVINARIGNPKKTVIQMRGGMKIAGPLSPLFAVPTTAGTGSECSLGAMVSDPESHEKFGVASPYIIPPYAVLDAELMIGLPPHITSVHWHGCSYSCGGVLYWQLGVRLHQPARRARRRNYPSGPRSDLSRWNGCGAPPKPSHGLTLRRPGVHPSNGRLRSCHIS